MATTSRATGDPRTAGVWWATVAAFALACVPSAAEPDPLDIEVRGDVDGWVLTHLIPDPEAGGGITGIVDRDGHWVWWTETEPGLYPMSGRVALDGRSIAFGEFEPTNQGVDRGRAAWVDIATGTREVTRLVRGHHDFVEHADGTVGFLSLHTVDLGQDFPLGFDRIDEVRRGASAEASIRTVYDTYTSSPVEPYGICSHIQRSRPKFGERLYEWTHANSLLWDPEEGVYYLHAKWTDWYVKVDRATGVSEWVMNGDGGSFTLSDGASAWQGPEASALWSHGHMSQAWSGGLMMFDNGLHHPEQVSSLVRVAYDEEARTADVVWSYAHPDGLLTRSMGDAKRLDSGNVIGSWADLSEITEVTDDGTLVWHARGPEGAIVGRTTWLSHLPEGLSPRAR